jgi:hypothetical protein
VDKNGGIIYAVFSCHILISSFFQVCILLEHLVDGAAKVLTIIIIIIIIKNVQTSECL